MNLKLKKMIIKNFRGIKNFELNVAEEITNIRGNNGTGKTTIADAFYWLFFDKDSLGRTNFDIFPYSNVEAVTTVEAEVDIDGEFHTLKKVREPKYKNNEDKILGKVSGYKNFYFVDGKSISKSKYNEQFNIMYSDPLEFLIKMNWEDRLDILFNMVNYDKINSELKEKYQITLTDKEIKSKIKDLQNKDMFIKEKIAEYKERFISNIKESDLNNLEDQLKNLLSEEKMLSQGEDLELVELEKTYNQKRNDYFIKSKNEIKKLEDEYNKIKGELIILNSKVCSLKNYLDNFNTDLDGLLSKRATYNEKYTKLKEKYQKFLSAEEYECPVCKSKLSKEKYFDIINKSRAKEFKQFNGVDMDNLDSKIESIEKQINETEENIERVNNEISELKSKQERVNKKINELKNIDVNEIKDVKEIAKKIEARKEEFDKTNKNKSRLEIKSKIEDLQNKIIDMKSNIEMNSKIKIRIDELEKEKIETANKLILFEKQKVNYESYIKELNSSLEVTINNLFDGIQFKIWKINYNGNYEKMCEPLVAGIPIKYVNHGLQINSGLNAISKLSKTFNIKMPVIIDNAESITKIKRNNLQLIKLIVDEEYDELKINEKI